MGGQSYNLSYNVDVKASISSIKNLVNEIQQGLNKISLPLGSSRSFNSSISTILDELKELDRLSSKTSLSLADTKNADKSWSKIDVALGRIKTGLKDLGLEGADAAKSIEKLFPESTAGKFKQLTLAIEKAQKALKGEDDSSESKKLKERLKSLELSKKVAEDERKEKRLTEKEERDLRGKQRIIEEATKGRRAQGKFGFDDSKEVDKYLKDLQQIKKIREEIKEAGKKKKQDKSEENIETYERLKKRRDELISKFNKKYGTSLKGQGQDDQGDFTKSIEKYKKAIEEIGPLQEKFSKFTKADSAVQELESQIEEVAQSLDKLGKSKGQQTLDELAKTVSELTGKNIDEIPRDLGEIEKIVSNFKIENVQELSNYLKQVANSANTAEKETEELNESLQRTNRDVFSQDQARQDIEHLQYQIRDFFSVSNTIQIFKRTVRDAFDTVKELDAVMTETAVVTDFTVSDMWDKLPEYAKNASELGSSISGLYKATTLYYQQGLGDVAAMDVGTETMKMARIANMDAADATEAMTAALRGFNMEIDKTSATRINDVYSELAAITAADTSQIATAMTKTASIAASANMEFETTAAFLAQIIETTQEAPETAGTAMKTIIARFTEVKELFSQGMLTGEDSEGEAIEINKIDKALQSVGISLKDFLLGKKGIDDIFLELAEKWDTLDLATQRYIATTAAGSRQQSRFIAMMSDYDRTMELVNAANNSAGSSQNQFNKTLDSLDAKLQKLQNAWQRFTMGIVDSDLFKAGIDLLTGLLESINAVTEALGGFGGPLAKIGLIGGALKMGGNLLGQKTGLGGLGNLLSTLIKKEGGGATQTLGQTLASEAKGFVSQTGFGQKYLMADSVLGRVWGKIYKPTTGADAPKKNPYYQKAIDYIDRRKALKSEAADLTDEIADLKQISPKNYRAAQKELSDKQARLSGINEELNIPKQKIKDFGKGGGYMAAAGMAAMIGGDIAEGAGQAQGKEGLEAWGTGIKSAGATAAALGTLSGALAAFGMAIPGANIIIAATAAMVGLYKGLEKAAYLKSDEHALELAQANKKLAEENAQKEQERVKNMTALTDDLQEKYSNIDNMTKGTSEWKKAVAELNQEIADTIVQVPELAGAFKMEDGVLRADQTKLTEIAKVVETQAQVAETNVAIADYEETVAENNLAASDLYDKLFGDNFSKKWGDDKTKRATLDKLLASYTAGEIQDYSDIIDITGITLNPNATYENIIQGINQYAGIKAQTSTAQATRNQEMISSAQATGALTDEQAETMSSLSESFLNDFYEESRAAAQEGFDDWGHFKRRNERIEYASEHNLKYKRGFFGWGSKFVDANGNPVEVTDDMIRSEEINTATQQEYNQRAQNFANILKSNPLLARAMSVGGGQLEQSDLNQMSKMFGTTETGDLVFDAKKFAASMGFESAEELAKEMGFEGKEGEFFGQIAQNFQSRLEKSISTAMDNVQMANALKLSEEAVKAFNTEELQAQANDFYSLMQMRNMGTDAMRAGMEVFADLAEAGDTYGMEQLSELVSEINFDNPIKAFEQLQRAAERGTYAEKQYANAIINSGSQMIGTGAQLQYFLRSEDFDAVWEELEGIVELNGTIEPEDVLDLADSYDVLNDLMEQTSISAVGLGKAIELVGEGMMSADSMTDAVIAALSAMSSIDEEIARGLKDAASFDAGQDENQAAGFISQAYETLNTNIEKGAWGNSQNAAYLDELFGTGWRSDEAEVQAQNMKDLTKFLGQNAENMSNAWRMAAKGETLVGGDKSALDALGLTLDSSTGEVRMGDQVAGMNSDQIIDALSTGFGVSEQMARLMLADFKNYSKDFDLLLSIAKNDEAEGAKQFKQQIDQRSDVIGQDKKTRKAVDKAELQTTALAYGYEDTPEQTAGEQYAAAHGITSENGYLVTDFYYEDGSRKGGVDLSRALGAAYMGVDAYSMEDATEQQQKSWETAFASEGSGFYTPDTSRTVTGTWDDYINAGTEFEKQGRFAQATAAMQEAQAIQNVLDQQTRAVREGNQTWNDYIYENTPNDAGDYTPEQRAQVNARLREYQAWRAENEAIVSKKSQATWTEHDMAEFDYEGMTELIESYGATAEEAASVAQSQIDAQLDATGQQSANLKMWSDVLGDYMEVEYQKGDNIQKEFQAVEAQKKQEQQIATLREALGIDEGGVLKVAIEGITDGEATEVTFDPDTTAVQAAREEMAKPIDVQVSFSGSGSVTATGSAGGTFTVQLAAHASGIVDAPNTHDALLGEGGPELVQTKNGAWIAGLNGPEVGTIHKGDTVYTAEETKQIFNPKKNSMPRFEGGTGPGAYSGVTSKSGGKTAGNGNEWENPFDKLYNLLRKIDEELRERERIERRYEKLLEDLGVSADKIISISREELAQLEKERQYQEQLVTGRRDQIDAYQQENSDLLQYASVTQNERGEDVLRIDWEAIDAITDKEKGAEIETYVNQLEEWFDSLTEAEDALWEIEDLVAEIKERGKDEYFDLEETIKDALENSYQEQIDEFEKISDSINDTNAELLEGIQKTISQQRQDRENEKTEEDLADKQRRLAYLQMDTSGANATEILKLQKEIEEGQENHTDTLIDQKISELQEQNDEAAKQREKQIDLMQAQLDHYIESGQIWNDVFKLMDEGLNGENGLVKGSELEQLLQSDAGIKGMSAIGKMEWMNETNNMIAQALAYLELGRQLEDIGVEAGTEIEFVTADGQTLTGTVDEKGVVTTADGKEYDNIYQTYDGTFRAGENIAPVEAEEVEENPNSGSGSGTGTGTGTGAGSGYYSVTAAGKTFTGKTYAEAYNAAVNYINSLKDEALADAQAEAEGGDINASNATHIKDSYDQLIRDYDNQIANLKPTWQPTVKTYYAVGPDGKTYTGTTQEEANRNAANVKPKEYVASGINFHGVSVSAVGKTADEAKHLFNSRWYLYPTSVTPRYKTGGLADFTGPAWLDGTKSRPELVLNQRDTENFIQLKDILSSILSHNLGNSTSTENNGDTTFDIDINVESIGNDYDVDKVASRVKALITEDARYRNNNAVSLKR